MDFGTSNSSIARFDQGKIQLFPIDPGNISPNLLRSFIYMTRDYEHFVGTAAVREYLQHETGRPVYWETRQVGTIKNVWGGVPSTGGEPIFEERDVVAEVDIAARGRLVQSVKTALRRPGTLIRGRSDSPRIQVFERLYPIEDLIAFLMKSMRESAERELNIAIEGVVIGRPVRISEDANIDARGEDILREAAQFAGFKHVSFELEPVAAAYVYHQQTSERQTALVFDFGGGSMLLHAGARYMSSHEVDFANKPELSNDSSTVVDASVSYYLDAWYFSLFGRNLTDDDSYALGFDVAGLWSYAAVRPPRTYGFEVGYSW